MHPIIRGVHLIDAPEPVHLVEIELAPSVQEWDWGKVTQETASLDQQDWQVAWDEQCMDKTGTQWVFFFHYLDVSKPLLTPHGPVELPEPSPIPEHLQHIEYEQP